MSDLLAIGDLVIARFPSQKPQGREQEGIRPALIVGFPQRIGIPRFLLTLAAPLTTDRRQSWVLASPELYPKLSSGQGNLSRWVLKFIRSPRPTDTPLIKGGRGDRAQKFIVSLIATSYLPRNSIVLLDQIRAIDLNRIDRYLGTLTIEEYQPIFLNIQKMLSPDFLQK